MITLILLIIILGLLIFVHEFGHFITAKNRGAYVYEFSLGMGPKLFGWKRKNDPTSYSIRLFPIGGYCAIAGEDSEDDGGDVKLKKNQYMCNKKIWERCLILIAGVCMNFITGFVILLVSALIWGAPNQASIVGVAPEGYPVSEAGIEVGDRILTINGKNAKSWDKITLILNIKQKSDVYKLKVKKTDGTIKTYDVTPIKQKDDDGNETRVFGIGQSPKRKRGIIYSLKYAFTKLWDTIYTMWAIIINLITGNLSMNALSGPIGVYNIVGEARHTSVESVLYLAAYLSINLGFINILPFPAFDGGRVLFLIIEAIRKKKMNPKIEHAINAVGFALLMILMIVISIKDVINLIK